MKTIMLFQNFYVLKLLILIYIPLPHISGVKENFYGKRFTTKNLLLVNLTNNLNCCKNNVKSNLNLIEFHHSLNISLISNEKELERIKFRHLSKLKIFLPDFSWDVVATPSHDPEKVIFNFSSYELSSNDKDPLSKRPQFAVPPKQIDYSNFMTKFELWHLKKEIVLKPN